MSANVMDNTAEPEAEVEADPTLTDRIDACSGMLWPALRIRRWRRWLPGHRWEFSERDQVILGVMSEMSAVADEFDCSLWD